MMSPDEVWQKIMRELGDDWDRPNHHGIVLSRCLVRPPELRNYNVLQWPPKKLEGLTADGRPSVEVRYSVVELWLVLEEKPETKGGYKIVYDEKSGLFGLAASGEPLLPGDTFEGPRGTFIETLEAM